MTLHHYLSVFYKAKRLAKAEMLDRFNTKLEAIDVNTVQMYDNSVGVGFHQGRKWIEIRLWGDRPKRHNSRTHVMTYLSLAIKPEDALLCGSALETCRSCGSANRVPALGVKSFIQKIWRRYVVDVFHIQPRALVPTHDDVVGFEEMIRVLVHGKMTDKCNHCNRPSFYKNKLAYHTEAAAYHTEQKNKILQSLRNNTTRDLSVSPEILISSATKLKELCKH